MTSLSTLELANAYFETRLNTRVWNGSGSNKKQLALNDATRIIDQFNFLGEKTVSTQEHEWPRQGVYVDRVLIDSNVIPEAILIALYEIAHALLKGFDPEKEIRATQISSRGISSVRATYDTKLVPEYLQLGVPSAVAWSYLSPYLDRLDGSGLIKLHRAS